jgi:hypothetical protein
MTWILRVVFGVAAAIALIVMAGVGSVVIVYLISLLEQ